MGSGAYICPVELLEAGIAKKAVINGGYCRTPHQYHDAEIVELIPYFGDLRAMVIENMEAGARLRLTFESG